MVVHARLLLPDGLENLRPYLTPGRETAQPFEHTWQVKARFRDSRVLTDGWFERRADNAEDFAAVNVRCCRAVAPPPPSLSEYERTYGAGSVKVTERWLRSRRSSSSGASDDSNDARQALLARMAACNDVALRPALYVPTSGENVYRRCVAEPERTWRLSVCSAAPRVRNKETVTTSSYGGVTRMAEIEGGGSTSIYSYGSDSEPRYERLLRRLQNRELHRVVLPKLVRPGEADRSWSPSAARDSGNAGSGDRALLLKLGIAPATRSSRADWREPRVKAFCGHLSCQ